MDFSATAGTHRSSESDTSRGWAVVLPAAIVAAGASLFTAAWLGLFGEGPDLGASQRGIVGVWIPGTAAAALAFAAMHPRVARPVTRPVILGLLVGVAVPYLLAILWEVASNIARPPGWDIGGFVILGQAAAHGTPYDVEFYHQAALAYPVPTKSFVEELTPWYHPQAFLLFLPLGLAPSLSAAASLWYAIQLSALAASIFLIWRTFLADVEGYGLPLAAVLVMSFWPTLSMVSFGQSDALLLCATTLLVLTQTRPVTGLWLALGAVVKPIFVVMVLVPLVRRHWRIVAIAGAAFLVPTLLSLALFGSEAISGFVSQLGTLGAYRFTQEVNTSLSSILTRLPFAERGPAGLSAPPVSNPFFLGLGLAIAIVTVYLIDQRDRVSWTTSVALVVPVALLVYPASLVHYMMLLLVPLLAIWRERETLGIRPHQMALLTVLVFAATGVQAGQAGAFATVALWCVLVGLVVRSLRRPTDAAASGRLPSGGMAGSMPGSASA
jgi:hypothetical protein